MLFLGITEKQYERWEESPVIINEFMRTHLGFEASVVERVHRVGGKRGSATYPIVMRSLNYQSKQDVLYNARKLKKQTKNVASLRVSISVDSTPETRLHRSKRWQFSEQFKESDIKVKLVYDKLHADGKQFCY